MTLIFIISGLMLIWFLVQMWPVPSLTYLGTKEWNPLDNRWSNVKTLDVRDSSEYWLSHIPTR